MLGTLYAAIAAEMASINAYVVPLIGEEHVRRHDPPPRLILIPLDGTPTPVEGPGGNPRPLQGMMMGTDVVIHAQDLDTAVGMHDQLVIALHHVCKRANTGNPGRAGRYVLGKGKWTRDTLIGKNGVEYRSSFAVAYAIVDRKWADGPTKQKPDASTYTGDQANTYPIVSDAQIDIDVGVRDEPPADDNVTIVINPVSP